MNSYLALVGALVLVAYLLLVRRLRYQRARRIASPYGESKRPLSSMTVSEACDILYELETLEFPFSFRKGRAIALLKSGAIPSMSRVFAATGQNKMPTAIKRSLDTQVLMLEAQLNGPESPRMMQAVARMNYLHARYRAAGKILDEDMLHTLSDGVGETVIAVNDQDWRPLTQVELCALGVFYKSLGHDMDIPFTPLPSSDGTRFGGSWPDGISFARELAHWGPNYELQAAVPHHANFHYTESYLDHVELWMLPGFIKPWIRRIVASQVTPRVATALGLELPGSIMRASIWSALALRSLLLRNLALPRPRCLASKELQDAPNPVTGRLAWAAVYAEPWYADSSSMSLPMLTLRRWLGGAAPGHEYMPDGYDIRDVGPKAQRGRGRDDMAATVRLLQSLQRGGSCPFGHGAAKA